MAFTFDPTLSSPRDRIRQLIGDTDSTHPQIPDETIDYYTGVDSVELSVAYKLALDLAARYARYPQITVDHQMTNAVQISANYRALAAELLTQLRNGSAGATEDQPGIVVTGIGDCRGPYDVWTLPPLCPPQ